MERGVGSIWCFVLLIPGLLPGCWSQGSHTVVLNGYRHNSTLTSGDSVPLGTQIILVCRVVGLPYGTPLSYTWICPNGPCEVEGYYGRKVCNEHILAINTTDITYGGTYTCQVTATGEQEATGNFTIRVTGGDVVHSFGRLIPLEFPITDLQQISGPDGIGRINCTVSSGRARFIDNSGNRLETGGVSQTRNAATAILVLNPSNVDSFQNRDLYCNNVNNFFYLFISSANPLRVPSLLVDRVTNSAVEYRVQRNDVITNAPLITGYEVTRFGVPMIGQYVNTAGRGRRVTISPAVPGAQYRITAWALGDGGRSATPAVVNATTGEAGPSSPKSLSIAREFQNGIELNWLPPIEPNGEVHYVIYYTPEGGTEQSIDTGSDLTHYNLTGLERNRVYTNIAVLANNSAGRSRRSAVIAQYNHTPDVPHPTNGNVSVVALNEAGKVKVTWSTPTLGPGQVITGYSVQYRRRGTASYTTRSVSGSNTTSFTITNLNLGTVYEVRVASVGPLGLSEYCCGSGKQVTTYNRSKPPTAVTAVPGVNLGSIRVTWVAPLDTGGVPITGYYIQYRIQGSSSYAIQLSQPQPTEATVSGLRLGTTYQVRVAALTAIGIGPYCCTQTGHQVFARTRDVPAKVSGVSAVPGVRSGRPTIRVTWSTPKSDEPISKYHLQYRKATASSWTAITLAPSETSTVLSGLDRGTVYHVQVRAISVVGSGPFSDRQQVTTHNVPSFITALSVSPTESAHRPALSVSWSPPQSDLPILHYTVSYSLRDSGAVTNITTTSTHVLIPELSIGATYQVAVASRSALGEGPRSVWVHQTTFSLPRQVTGVALSRVVRSGAPALRVTWTAPQSDTAITHYRVRHRKNGMKDWTSRTVSGSPPPTVTYLEGLSLGTAYEVQLQAESAIGPGNFSEVQTATAFDVPASVPEASFAITTTVIGGRSSLSVQWRPPFSDLPILGYTVTVEVSSSVGGRGREVTTTSTSLIVENLAIGTTYTIHLKARSAVGFGAEVQKLANTLDVLPPDEVHSYPLPQRGTVRVTWTVTPNSTHGLTLTGYSVQYREEGGDKYQSQQVTEVPSPGELETFELEGLELGTTYELRVAVVTLSGVGKYSDVINVTTYADCCSECSSIQSTMFVSFEVGSMKVDESDSLVHIDVFRYGPMSDPITLRVTDIPVTAKRVEDYSLQSSSLVFLNTERMVERSTVVVRIREDSIAEQDPPTESFRLVLSSTAAGGGMQPAVVFSVPEMEVHIRDNDY